MTRRNRIAFWTGAVALAFVIIWMLLRPDRVATVSEVSPALIAQVRALAPSWPERPAAAVIRFDESDAGQLQWRRVSTQPIGNGVFRRDSKRYQSAEEIGVLEESSSLVIGPILLSRIHRNPMPFVGDLLPNHFWTALVLRRVEAAPAARYPREIGAEFKAKLWMESFLANGVSEGVEQTTLECKVTARTPAQQLHNSLTGEASKLRCEEAGPASDKQKRLVAHILGDSIDMADAQYVFAWESWYVDQLGITIQTMTEESFRLRDGSSHGGLATTRTVKSIQVKSPLGH